MPDWPAGGDVDSTHGALQLATVKWLQVLRVRISELWGIRREQ